jgi:hypothetical protein
MVGGNLKSFVQPAGADPAQREGSNALPGKADIESGVRRRLQESSYLALPSNAASSDDYSPVKQKTLPVACTLT